MTLKEYPIIFTEENLRLILRKKKVQTRRIIKRSDYYLKWKKDDLMYVKEPVTKLGDEWVYKWDYSISTRSMFAKWKSPIFMPKNLARIWLQIKDIRTEKLRDMKSEDFSAEGIPKDLSGFGNEFGYYTKIFSVLWDSINSKYGERWSDNPWVRVIEFGLYVPLEGLTDRDSSYTIPSNSWLRS